MKIRGLNTSGGNWLYFHVCTAIIGCQHFKLLSFFLLKIKFLFAYSVIDTTVAYCYSKCLIL